MDSATRLFPYIVGYFDIMTNDFCILACADKGYAFAGTEVLLIMVYTFFMKPNMLYFYPKQNPGPLSLIQHLSRYGNKTFAIFISLL